LRCRTDLQAHERDFGAEIIESHGQLTGRAYENETRTQSQRAALKIWQTFERPIVPCLPALPRWGTPHHLILTNACREELADSSYLTAFAGPQRSELSMSEFEVVFPILMVACFAVIAVVITYY